MVAGKGSRRRSSSRVRSAALRLGLVAIAALLVLITLAPGLRPVAASAPGDPIDHPAFHRLWARTDLPIVKLRVSRSWTWGEKPLTPLLAEPVAEGARYVQYFDKGAIEFNSDPAIPLGHPAWTLSSPLAREMVSGQVIDGTWRSPARIAIAGDPDDPLGPTYATFSGLLDAPPAGDGALVLETVDRQGKVSRDARFARYGVTAAYRVQLPGLDHQIASPFAAFIESEGLIYRAGQFVDAPLFEDRWAMVGLPLTEAYWAQVKVRGEVVDVLVQVFERRVLTYTPSEPEGWQVQFANTGRHYLDWRYGGLPDERLAADPDALPAPAPPDYDALRAELEAVLASADGELALAVLDLQTNELISINGDRRRLAASVAKMPIMIAVARDITAGRYSAADVEYLVVSAMGDSENHTARELLRIIGNGDVGAGIRRINAILRAFGAKQSIVTHPPGYWGEEYGYAERLGETENWLTAEDTVRLFAGVWRGRGLTESERDYILWSLDLPSPFFDGPIRAALPDEAAAFHKTGVILEPENVWNDAGIVVFERGGEEYAYAYAFLSSRTGDSYMSGYYLNQQINQVIWEAFNALGGDAEPAMLATADNSSDDLWLTWWTGIR